MHIGDLAEKTGLSVRSIRHYGDIGLLPASGRSEGGFRLYTEDDLRRLFFIKSMKPLGLSLDEINELIDLMESDSLDAPEQARLQELTVRVQEKTATLERFARQGRELEAQLKKRLMQS